MLEPESTAVLGQLSPMWKSDELSLWVVLCGCKASKDTLLLFRAPRRTRVNGDSRL